MKSLLAVLVAVFSTAAHLAWATTISVVPIFEPLSLHGTDVDGDITEIGEALQATVSSRPMALTGAFPEDLVEAIRTPHLIPSNNPNYKVTEANLLILCDIRLTAESTDDELQVTIDIAKITVPGEVEPTSRQWLKLILVAIRKTLEAYQAEQTDPVKVKIQIDGATEGREPLQDLATEFQVAGGSTSR